LVILAGCVARPLSLIVPRRPELAAVEVAVQGGVVVQVGHLDPVELVMDRLPVPGLILCDAPASQRPESPARVLTTAVRVTSGPAVCWCCRAGSR
jgi:hypothetical protein